MAIYEMLVGVCTQQLKQFTTECYKASKVKKNARLKKNEEIWTMKNEQTDMKLQ